jgi:DNA repair exonuclease SbcCD ATPase subunit
MQASSHQISLLEDDLSNRYLDLEASATECNSVEEYNQMFDHLEDERRSLEDEKLKLQEHFSRKLQSIKDTYSESEQRIKQQQELQKQKELEDRERLLVLQQHKKVQQQQHRQQQQQQTVSAKNGGLNNQHSNSPGSQGKGGKDTAPALVSSSSTTLQQQQQQQHSQQKPKWVMAATKLNTHNFHLKNLQSNSTKQIQVFIYHLSFILSFYPM